MRRIGQVRDRPEAGGRDRRRAGAKAGVEHLEGPGVHDDGQVPAGGAAAPGGRGASVAVKCPCIVTRNTGMPPVPGMKSPGVAEVSALTCVVSTAVICDGAASASAVAARLPMAVSRGIADAGTGGPAPADDPAQPAAASPVTTASTHASAAAARASGRAAISGCVTSSAFMPVGRSRRPCRLHAARPSRIPPAAPGGPATAAYARTPVPGHY